LKKSGVFLSCLVILVAVAMLAAAPPGKKLTARGINAAIKAQGAHWVAVENKFARIRSNELKAMLGGPPPDIAGDREGMIDRGKPGSTLPAAFDWRNANSYNWMTPVKDQTTACAAGYVFAPVAALEAKIRIFNSNPGFLVDLSEQFLLSCESSSNGCLGGSASQACSFLKDLGIPDEACFPYAASDLNCAGFCADWASRSYRIASWKRLTNNKVDPDKIKSAIYANGPIPCYMDVYEDFYSYGSGCYQHVTGAYLGGHTVCLVGWTSDGCWIAKNSWGTAWGEDGYFRIKFGDCRIGTEAIKLEY
jgi:C1A family cysteine protease